MTSGKCKLKWEITNRLSEWPRFGKLTAPTAGEYIELQEFLLIAQGNAKRTAALEDSVAASYKTKHTLTIRSSNFSPQYLPKLIKNLCSHTKNLHMSIHSSFIHNCQNVETIKTSFNKWMNKQSVTFTQWNIIQW